MEEQKIALSVHSLLRDLYHSSSLKSKDAKAFRASNLRLDNPNFNAVKGYRKWMDGWKVFRCKRVVTLIRSTVNMQSDYLMNIYPVILGSIKLASCVGLMLHVHSHWFIDSFVVSVGREDPGPEKAGRLAVDFLTVNPNMWT